MSNRTEYTAADDNYLVQYIAKYRPTPAGRLGNSLYQTLCEDVDRKWKWSKRHSWQSWRNRYKTNQMEFDEKILKHQQRLAAKAAVEEQPSAEPSKAGQKRKAADSAEGSDQRGKRAKVEVKKDEEDMRDIKPMAQPLPVRVTGNADSRPTSKPSAPKETKPAPLPNPTVKSEPLQVLELSARKLSPPSTSTSDSKPTVQEAKFAPAERKTKPLPQTERAKSPPFPSSSHSKANKRDDGEDSNLVCSDDYAREVFQGNPEPDPIEDGEQPQGSKMSDEDRGHEDKIEYTPLYPDVAALPSPGSAPPSLKKCEGALTSIPQTSNASTREEKATVQQVGNQSAEAFILSARHESPKKATESPQEKGLPTQPSFMTKPKPKPKRRLKDEDDNDPYVSTASEGERQAKPSPPLPPVRRPPPVIKQKRSRARLTKPAQPANDLAPSKPEHTAKPSFETAVPLRKRQSRPDADMRMDVDLPQKILTESLLAPPPSGTTKDPAAAKDHGALTTAHDVPSFGRVVAAKPSPALPISAEQTAAPVPPPRPPTASRQSMGRVVTTEASSSKVQLPPSRYQTREEVLSVFGPAMPSVGFTEPQPNPLPRRAEDAKAPALPPTLRPETRLAAVPAQPTRKPSPNNRAGSAAALDVDVARLVKDYAEVPHGPVRRDDVFSDGNALVTHKEQTNYAMAPMPPHLDLSAKLKTRPSTASSDSLFSRGSSRSSINHGKHTLPHALPVPSTPLAAQVGRRYVSDIAAKFDFPESFVWKAVIKLQNTEKVQDCLQKAREQAIQYALELASKSLDIDEGPGNEGMLELEGMRRPQIPWNGQLQNDNSHSRQSTGMTTSDLMDLNAVRSNKPHRRRSQAQRLVIRPSADSYFETDYEPPKSTRARRYSRTVDPLPGEAELAALTMEGPNSSPPKHSTPRIDLRTRTVSGAGVSSSRNHGESRESSEDDEAEDEHEDEGENEDGSDEEDSQGEDAAESPPPSSPRESVNPRSPPKKRQVKDQSPRVPPSLPMENELHRPPCSGEEDEERQQPPDDSEDEDAVPNHDKGSSESEPEVQGYAVDESDEGSLEYDSQEEEYEYDHESEGSEGEGLATMNRVEHDDRQLDEASSQEDLGADEGEEEVEVADILSSPVKGPRYPSTPSSDSPPPSRLLSDIEWKALSREHDELVDSLVVEDDLLAFEQRLNDPFLMRQLAASKMDELLSQW